VAGEAGIEKLTRQAMGVAGYRMAITLALLTAGFTAFPTHKLVFALAVIAFSLGLSTLAIHVHLLDLVNNKILDVAERKTRHTIVVAQERSSRGQPLSDGSFWVEVEERVATEIGDPDPAPPWWKAISSIAWSGAGYAIGDVAMVLVALFLSGGLQSI